MGTSSGSWASQQSFLRLILASTVKIFSSEKNLICPDASFFREHNNRLQRATRLVLAASKRICRIFNVYDLYRRSSSAFLRRIVGSLTPTIDANFHNDCPGSSEISDPFDHCRGLRGAFFRVTLPRWRTGTFVWLFWSTIFCHVINDWSQISKKPSYFRWWSSSAKAFDNCGSSIIFSAWCRHRGYFEFMTVYWKHQAYSITKSDVWRKRNMEGNLNWNLSGFW